MNKIILTGRITKDPELRHTKNGNPICEFTIATNRTAGKDGEKTADFINIQVWGTQAENLVKYQSKGNIIAVSGELRTDSYETKEEKKYKTYVLANNIEFLESKKLVETNIKAKTEVQQQFEYKDEDLPW